MFLFTCSIQWSVSPPSFLVSPSLAPAVMACWLLLLLLLLLELASHEFLRFCSLTFIVLISLCLPTCFVYLISNPGHGTTCKQAPFFPCLLTVGRESRDWSYEELHFLHFFIWVLLVMHVPELQQVLATRVSPSAEAHLPAPPTHLLFFSCSSLVLLLFFSPLRVWAWHSFIYPAI